jgi:hypothetical protein
MVDFANLLAEYMVRVALWPGLGLSLPLALALLWLRRALPLAGQAQEVGGAGQYLASMAVALVLLASLPLAGLSVTLAGFGLLPSGQQLADALFALLALPLAALALFDNRVQAWRWLRGYIPATGGMLAALAMRHNGLILALAMLAYLALLLTSDALMSEAEGERATRWLHGLSQQISWLVIVALPLTILLPLPPAPLLAELIYGGSAVGAATIARLLNRRWQRLGRASVGLASGAALLALMIVVFES